ncbi:MAG: TlpA disulfide reductase family protein [Opitutaceae bacterium]
MAYLDTGKRCAAIFLSSVRGARGLLAGLGLWAGGLTPGLDAGAPDAPAPAGTGEGVSTAEDPRWRAMEQAAAVLESPTPGATREERELGRDLRLQAFAAMAWDLYVAHPQDSRRWGALETVLRSRLLFLNGYEPGTPPKARIDEVARQTWDERVRAIEEAAATASDAPASLRELLAGRKVSALVLPYTNTTLPTDWEARLVPPIEHLAGQFPEGSGAFVYFSRLVHAVESQFPADLPRLVQRMSTSPSARVRELADRRQRVLAALAEPVDLRFTAVDGRRVDTQQWRGRVILVDFWATWCVPCIQAMPHLRELHERYHGRGLEIIGVSLDRAGLTTAVEKVVREQALPWPQLYEGRAHQTECAVRYGVQPIPHVLLFGKDGRIVAVNPSRRDLEAHLERLLGDAPKS